ncbi:MAG: alpha/beta hydrolase [Acidobacteria bacterium]|nr:alpha/beta hydrolase [Acidobacteriota bacterium]MBV9069366.1 alpha/beta hydrolase [Acidobacteriota bacterium]MBV9187142.1 alpha/beta hydrolase [Acidobacteriota bacterium]
MGRRPAADRTEPACRLVRFEAADGVALAGLLFEPRRKSKRAIIWLHGGGGASVFESRRTNLLASVFIAHGIAFFPFNNRGSGIVRRAGDDLGGSAFERIRDCVADIDGAIRELWRRGYRGITLAGHSTGANKIAVYDHYKPRNRAKRYVLLAGGDDTGILYAQLGARKFNALLTKAKSMIKSRRGEEIVPPIPGQTMLSWRALYDVANPDGDYNVFPFFEAMTGTKLSRRPFRSIRGIRKPSLYIYGDRDEYCFDDVPRCVSILAQNVGDRAEIVVMHDADHGFSGREEEIGAIVASWVER